MNDSTSLRPIELAQVIFPRDANETGRATAGVIMKTIDITASLAATQHSGTLNVTASLDQMDFLQPAYVWELLRTRAQVTRTWRTSMEIAVWVEAHDPRRLQTRQVATGYLVFVSIDDQTDQPQPVKPFEPSDDAAKQLWTAAEQRRQIRLAEKEHLGQLQEIEIDSSEQAETVAKTMTPNDANIHNHVFGGAILELIHQAGEKAAFRHVNGPVIAARQDRMSFEQPAFIGEEIRAQALVTRVWNTSFEVWVEVTARDHKTQAVRRIASSSLVYIAQDAQGHPKLAMVFEPLTPKQMKRAQLADLRRENRLKRTT